MIARGRDSVMPTSGTEISVFNWANVPEGGYGLAPVPVKVNINGPFLDVDTISPVMEELRVGWNLVAPHTEDPARFQIVFRDALIPIQLASRALTLMQEVVAVGPSPTPILAEITRQFSIASFNALIDPRNSYWTNLVGGTAVMTPSASE